jgi:hypothetical protein
MKQKAGVKILTVVSGPPQRKSTFSKYMKMSIEKMETSAVMGNNHSSIMFRNTVFDKIRGALGTKFQINNSLAKASSGITQGPSVKARFLWLLLVSVASLGFGRFPLRCLFHVWYLVLTSLHFVGQSGSDVIGIAFEALAALASTSFEHTRGMVPDIPKRHLLFPAFFVDFAADCHSFEGNHLLGEHIRQF